MEFQLILIDLIASVIINTQALIPTVFADLTIVNICFNIHDLKQQILRNICIAKIHIIYRRNANDLVLFFKE